jgi:hypothetical protein
VTIAAEAHGDFVQRVPEPIDGLAADNRQPVLVINAGGLIYCLYERNKLCPMSRIVPRLMLIVLFAVPLLASACGGDDDEDKKETITIPGV